MFWRNNYSNEETMTEYLNSDDRTNYTYSESRSYRQKPMSNNVEQPKMLRKAINSHNKESIVTNVNTDNIMPLKSNSAMSTPRSKNRISLPNSRRVLRSKTLVDGLSKEISSTFVREADFDDDITKQSYRIGALNTNSNNTGQDEIDHTWSSSTGNCDYQLSADEDQGSEAATTSIDRHSAFGTNNANIKKSQVKVSNQWFQKNMYGLPNDESDDVHPEFSGAISGDEQYDIAPFQSSNTFHKSKLTRSKFKKISKSENSNNSMICSPVAVLSYLIEYVWLCVITTSNIVRYSSRHLTSYSNSPRWYVTPLYLPGALINSVIYWFVYSIDRLFGTTIARRWMVPQNYSRRSTFVRFVFNTVWILLWVAVAFIAMHGLVGHRSESTNQTSSIVTTVTRPLYGIIGQDCMEYDDCCKSNVAFGKRLLFCMFSLPARFVLSNSIHQSTDEIIPTIVQTNTSDIDVIINQIMERIRAQEQLVHKYNARMTNIEIDMKTKDSIHQSQGDSLKHLTEEILSVTNQLQLLRSDLKKFDSVKKSIEYSVEQVESKNKDGLNRVMSDVKQLREKLNEDIQLMATLVNKSDVNIKQTAINFSNILTQVKDNVGQLSIKFNEISERTIALESSESKSGLDTSALKKEILDEINKEFDHFKHDQRIILEKINEQMSKLEETIDINHSKLLDKDGLRALIESHLSTVESNIKNDVNSTMWTNVKEHIRHLFASSSINSEHREATDNLPTLTAKSAPCNYCNPISICRQKPYCVRISTVRKMIDDAIKLYSADRIGLADYALESAGGTIATTRCTETYTDRAATLTIFGIPLLRLTNSPRTIIQPNINPGECWAMKGNKGSVVVQLSATVLVNAVSIDHIPVSLSPSGSIDSAIKEFEIKALSQESDTIGQSLGNFTYDMKSTAVQTFLIEKPLSTNLVEMIIKSNYGNKEYTCIYRLRVHGNSIDQ